MDRALTAREAEILDFLLSAEFPSVEALRAQRKVVRLVGRCDCGCATIDLSVQPEKAPQSDDRSWEPVVEAQSRHDEGFPPYELLLFARDGWLSGLEIVVYEEDSGPSEFPPPNAFNSPWSRE